MVLPDTGHERVKEAEGGGPGCFPTFGGCVEQRRPILDAKLRQALGIHSRPVGDDLHGALGMELDPEVRSELERLHGVDRACQLNGS